MPSSRSRPSGRARAATASSSSTSRRPSASPSASIRLPLTEPKWPPLTTTNCRCRRRRRHRPTGRTDRSARTGTTLSRKGHRCGATRQACQNYHRVARREFQNRVKLAGLDRVRRTDLDCSCSTVPLPSLHAAKSTGSVSGPLLSSLRRKQQRHQHGHRQWQRQKQQQHNNK